MKNIGQSMKHEVISISDSAIIGDAAALFVEGHIGTLPVIDWHSKLVSILHIRDLLELVMPSLCETGGEFRLCAW